MAFKEFSDVACVVPRIEQLLSITSTSRAGVTVSAASRRGERVGEGWSQLSGQERGMQVPVKLPGMTMINSRMRAQLDL
jgi:hypothetical protein